MLKSIGITMSIVNSRHIGLILMQSFNPMNISYDIFRKSHPQESQLVCEL